PSRLVVQIAARPRYTALSEIALAIAPPADAPRVCPGDHARLTIAKPQPCERPRASAASASSDIAGVQNDPNARPAQTTSAASSQSWRGHGRTIRTIAEQPSPA